MRRGEEARCKLPARDRDAAARVLGGVPLKEALSWCPGVDDDQDIWAPLARERLVGVGDAVRCDESLGDRILGVKRPVTRSFAGEAHMYMRTSLLGPSGSTTTSTLDHDEKRN